MLLESIHASPGRLGEAVMAVLLWTLAGTALAHRSEVNHAVDADDDEADDDGGHGHPERVATQPLGAFYVPLVVTVQSLQRGDRESQLFLPNRNLLAKQRGSSEPTELINAKRSRESSFLFRSFAVPFIEATALFFFF